MRAHRAVPVREPYGRDVFRPRSASRARWCASCTTASATDGVRPVAPHADATDLVFVGELRVLKGVDVLLEALALLAREGGRVSATIVGDGPDADQFRAPGGDGSGSPIASVSSAPCRRAQAFALGRLLVVPSRAESLPYIVLEAPPPACR